MPKAPRGVQPRDLSRLAGRLGAAMDVLRGRQFGPGEPIAPQSAPDSEEQTAGPRQWEYPVSVNRSTQPRREDGRLMPFEQLRNLAASYDVAALCIATRIEEVQGLPFAVVAKDKRRQRELQPWCDQAEAFWQQPDRLSDFPSWLSMMLYDLFTIDALTLYKRPDLGGRLYGLDVVDGSTIKPVLDDRGRTVGYQQVLHGYPMSDYSRPSANEPGEQLPNWSTQQLLYKPRWVRSFTPYGFPPTEWIILRINMALRKQGYDLAWFTDGNIPDSWMSPPVNMQPEEIMKFEEWFNATLEGLDGARRKVRFLPFPADPKEMKGFSYDTQLDRFMMGITCASYGVTPAELGFVEDVNRSNGEQQENINERRGLGPLKRWMKQTIFDPVTHNDLDPVDESQSVSTPGQPTRPRTSPMKMIEAQWQGGESEDRLKTAQADKIYAELGTITPGELRPLRFGDVLDGTLPTPPAAVAPPEQPGTPSVMADEPVGEPVAKRDGDDVDPFTDRAAKERAAQRIFEALYAGQMKRIHAVLQEHEGELAAWQETDWYKQMWADELSQLQQLALPFYDDMLTLGAQAGADRLGIGVDWSLVNKDVLRYAKEEAARFSADVNTTSRGQLDQLIADWIEGGGTFKDLKARSVRAWTGPRPKVAAVTELTRIYAQGNRIAWAASGVVKGWRWRTAVDDRVCPICGPLYNATTVSAVVDEGGAPKAAPTAYVRLPPTIVGRS
jgi:hypothetical protein